MTGERNWNRAHRLTLPDVGRAIQLRPLKGCGHMPQGAPPLSNPRRWWCCGSWRQMSR